MKNEFKCKACGGSGKKWEECPDYHKPHIKKNEKGVCISHCSLAVDALCGFNNDIAMQCPTCKTGDMCLAIKCTRTPYSMIEPSGYYILSDAELEELNIEGECKSPICEADSWLCSEGIVAKCVDRKWTRLPLIEKGVITFKGSKVVLIPIEEKG